MATFSKFGPAGTLNGITDFTKIHVNGQNSLPGSVSASALGDRCDLVFIDGCSAFRMKRYVGDAQVASGKRTELVREQFADIADWVGEGVANATLEEAIHQYRWEYMVPEQDLSWLAESSTFCIVWQIHQTSDTNPADTAGLNPALAADLKMNSYGNLRWSLVANIDTDETTTVQDGSKHTREIASWPFKFNQWESLHVFANPWSYSEAGNLTVYRNRRPVLIHEDQENCPNDSPERGGGGLYVKFGVYMGSEASFTVYHRGLQVGDFEASFADMYPEMTDATILERVSGPKRGGVSIG